MGTMLVSLAHPDDETFGMGGTIALYAQRGYDVHLICATLGEAGTVSPEHLAGYGDIAELRRAELLCASEQLGLTSVELLGYRDSGMQGTEDNHHPEALVQVDPEHLVSLITGHIRRLKPEVVVTFDPNGGYGHPDHIAIHDATVEAFTAAADPERYPDQGEPFRPQKLYFLTVSMRVMKLLIPLVRLVGRDPTRWGRNRDIDLTEVFADQYPVHARINYRKVAGIKRRAISCHASQLQMSPEGNNRLIELLYRINRFDTVESFMRFHPEPSGARVEPDLFAGI